MAFFQVRGLTHTIQNLVILQDTEHWADHINPDNKGYFQAFGYDLFCYSLGTCMEESQETPHAPSVKIFQLGMDLLDVALGIMVMANNPITVDHTQTSLLYCNPVTTLNGTLTRAPAMQCEWSQKAVHRAC